MKIFLEQVAKRFRKQPLFRNITLHFEAPQRYALLGINGSGKSTLLRIIAGMQMPTQGKVIFTVKDKPIAQEQVYKYVSYCAPGMELIEEMTLREFLSFHYSLVPIYDGMGINDLIAIIGLEKFKEKMLEEFSSGMKQRVKLAQAIFTSRPVLLLDEPCTNLDKAGIIQYHQWIEQYAAQKLIIVASNDPQEYSFTKHHLMVQELSR